jgi:cAMP-dependent protein kinase regulator
MDNSDDQIEFERPFPETTTPTNSVSNSSSNEGISRIQAGLAPLNFRSSRRGSVSAESYQPLRKASTISANNANNTNNNANNTNNNTNNNTTNVSENARKAVKNNFLFKSLDPEQVALVFAGMTERPVHANEIVIRQGEEGDNFYIVERGVYGVEVDGKEVVQIGPGGSFGELALMYNSPRAATVRALQDDGLLYAVDRVTFRRVIIDLAHEKRCKYMDFLKSLPILASTLSDLEIGKLADALEEVHYATPKEEIIVQGHPGDSFYIILEGEAAVIKDRVQIGLLHPGDYFGELALLNRQPRAASIIVQSAPLKCLRLGEADFVRLLGPLEVLMKKRNEEQYNQYKQFIE